MNFFFRPNRVVATLALSALLTGCGLFNDKILVGALIQTPEIFVSAAEVFNGQNVTAPQEFTLPDGGVIHSGEQLPIGASIPADAGITVQAKAIGFAYFGKSPDFNMKLQGLDNSNVKVDIGGGTTLDYQSNGDGMFSIIPSESGAPVSLVGPNIKFTGRYQGEDYAVQVDGLNGQERIEAFHPQGFVIHHKAGEDFVFDRPAPVAGRERPLAFVTVIPVDSQGHVGNPTYNNLPKTVQEYISVVGAPNHWREKTVRIPGAAFAEVDQYYLIFFQSVKVGPAVTENLFMMSMAAAGLGDIGFVKAEQ